MAKSSPDKAWPRSWQNLFCLLVAAVGLACVVYLSIGWDPRPYLLPILLFTVLNATATRLGLRLGSGQKISLAHVTIVASFQVYGLIPALWSTLLGALLSDALRVLWPLPGEDPSRPGDEALRAAAMNAGMHILALVAGSAAFFRLGGALPVTGITSQNILPLTGLFLVYFLVDVGYFLLYQALGGVEIGRYIAEHLPRIIQVELVSLPLSILIAAIYNQGNLGNSLLLVATAVAAMLLTYYLDLSRRGLQQRVEELSALNAIGSELGRFLDLETLLEVIYRETKKVLDLRNFYVALYDAQEQELHFPIVYEGGERQRWVSRPFGSGLTEYVVETRHSLLLREDEEIEAARLGIEPVGKPSRSWLGVPLMAGDEVLGAMAVQDYEQNYAYDVSDLDLLSTIAGQAAIAIRNAQLYQQTDEQLANRVRQLQAVLDSTDEGMLFLDTHGQIILANPRLQTFWQAEASELIGHPLLSSPELLKKAGLAPSTTLEGLTNLSQSPGKAIVPLPGSGERVAERAISTVQDLQGEVAGWLLTFRNVTEEQKLAHLREDLSQMMIHDLRSPLSAIATALKMLQELGEDLSPERRAQLVEVGLRGAERLDSMVHTLLEIARLQSGELRPEKVPVSLRQLVRTVTRRLMPLASAADIRITNDAPDRLPLAHVDLSLMERVLSNLLDNAIKFSPDGAEIVIQAEPMERQAPPGEWLLLSVADQGPGVPSAYREAIFEKFGQVRSAPSRRRGAGLGLTFCRLAVEAHGGQIGLDCPGEGGSVFWFTVPVAPPEALAPYLDDEDQP